MFLRTRPAILLVALAASCSAGTNGTESLVSRELQRWGDSGFSCVGSRCTADTPGRTYRALDGRAVVSSPSSLSFHIERGDQTEIECGSEVFVRAFTSRATDLVVEVPPVLTFDDGSAVRLRPTSGLWVGDGCFEEVGRWEGTAGSYVGRAGDYLLVEDKLQATLTLNESAP